MPNDTFVSYVQQTVQKVELMLLSVPHTGCNF